MRDDWQGSDTVATNGTATIEFRPVNRRTNVVDQASTYAPNVGATATAALFRSGQFITFFVAQGDSIGEPPPLNVSPSQVLQFRWFGATPGASVSVIVFFDDGT